jgi:hypothetical protein
VGNRQPADLGERRQEKGVRSQYCSISP